MSEIEKHAVQIDFIDKVVNQPLSFEYSDNTLYNLSIPLLATILTLSRLPKPGNIEQFRHQLTQQIVELNEIGKKQDYPSAIIDKLCCLHCIVIDEFIIHGLWGADLGWENNTLLSELFGLKNGGELFYTVTDKAMKQASKMNDLLEVIYVLLQIGFKGRYRSRQFDQVGVITKNISEVIGTKFGPANILLQDFPQTKFRSLPSGVRFVSFSLMMLLALTLVTIFIDYWYDQSYQLRASPFLELDEATAAYVLNTQTRDIIYTSTAEDIHSVDHSFDPAKSDMSVETDSMIEHKLNNESSLFRVQLATFSGESNAKHFYRQFKDNKYPVYLTKYGQFFIIYSNATSAMQVEQQQRFYQEKFQLTPVIISNKISNSMNTKSDRF